MDRFGRSDGRRVLGWVLLAVGAVLVVSSAYLRITGFLPTIEAAAVGICGAVLGAFGWAFAVGWGSID